MRALWCAVILTCTPFGAGAQERLRCEEPAASMSAATFVECARAGTEKYRNRALAVADGYRRIGRDFPAMGEHWIRLSLLFDGKFHPSRPEVLNYVIVGGKPELAGVGYAVPLLADERVPDGPAGRDAWHDHDRTIENETVLPHHHAQSQERSGARLAMLHAWIWCDNPDGMFIADNWALPFLRAGLRPESRPPVAAARALSLATGGRDYFEMSIDAAGANGADERTAVKDAMDRAQASGVSVLEALQSDGIRDVHIARLVAIWTDMWNAIDQALAPQVRQKLSHLPIR